MNEVGRYADPKAIETGLAWFESLQVLIAARHGRCTFDPPQLSDFFLRIAGSKPVGTTGEDNVMVLQPSCFLFNTKIDEKHGIILFARDSRRYEKGFTCT